MVCLCICSTLQCLVHGFCVSRVSLRRTSLPSPVVFFSSPTFLASKSDEYISVTKDETQFTKDSVALMGHVIICLLLSMGIILWEGVECSFLKPESATIRKFPNLKTNNLIDLMASSTRGMGRGKDDRIEEWYREVYGNSLVKRDDTDDNNSLPQKAAWEIPSYNEIMLNHRTNRVPEWKQNFISQSDVVNAVDDIVRALEAVEELKLDALDYNYVNMQMKLRQPILTSRLSYSTSILQQAKEYLNPEARATIGFDWGSCAWRLCGAKADAQEALAELYNSIGMFEPFECLFTLDIVERSLRDMLDVIPNDYKTRTTSDYVPYESTHGENGDDTSDQEYLSALDDLRKIVIESE